MLNVLHLINYPGRGGSERYIVSLAEKLHNKKCRFYLAYSEEGPMIDVLKQLGVEVFNIQMKNPYDFKAAKSVKSICKQLSIDVVHTHFLRENFISVFSKLMGNRVVLVNTIHLFAKNNLLINISSFLLNIFVDRTIVVSNSLKKQISALGLSSRRIDVIHNGVDIDFWKGRRSLRARKKLGLDSSDFVITSVARFSEEKGHIFLLEAIKVFKKIARYNKDKIPNNVKFLLAGEGELLEECKGFAKALGVADCVIFTGYQENIREILHASDLYISHSKFETLGISILEALACRLPVVATNSGGPSEILTEENACGLLVDYGDTEGFAGAIGKFITDKGFYKKCRNNAFRTVEEKFNLDKTVEETYNLYIRSLTAGF
ncbi:MAG: glycosyltransferase family 4 protein [Acetivibrionales bacterium]|jgi:glycosyltransferase involved in cell wall biosynthesis